MPRRSDCGLTQKGIQTTSNNLVGGSCLLGHGGGVHVDTCGTPSQSSACCMASRALSTGLCGSQDSQSGHRPVRDTGKVLLALVDKEIKRSHVLIIKPFILLSNFHQLLN